MELCCIIVCHVGVFIVLIKPPPGQWLSAKALCNSKWCSSAKLELVWWL